MTLQELMGGMGGQGGMLATASPLLMSMAQGLQSGQGAFANAPTGLALMMAAKEQRDKDAAKKAAQEAMGQLGMGGYGGPIAGAPGGFTGGGAPSGVPTVSAQNAPANPHFSTGPSAGRMDQVFASLEQKFQLPSGYLSRTAQIESGGNPNAQNPNSSAGGMFQFIDSTAKQYGITNKNDPMQSSVGAARLAADNAGVLRRTLGREPTAGELYLAHQQGAGGAAALLSNPQARAADIVGADAVRLNGGNANMTAMDFANQWLGKFGGQPASPSSDPQIQQMLNLLQTHGEALDPAIRDSINTRIQMRAQELQAQSANVMTPYQAATLGMQQADQARAAQAGPQPTDDMREYEFAVQQGYKGSLQDFMLSQKRAGAVNVTTNVGDDTPADAAFYAGLDQAESGMYQGLLQNTPNVRRNAGTIDILEQQLANAPQGMGGAWRQIAGDMGLPVEGASDVQAAVATINAMVPDQRPAGSGTMSDADLKLFKESLPRIINQPGGNALIIAKMRAINAYDASMSEIANKVVSREMTRSEARQAMAAVPNPLENYAKEVRGLTQAGTVAPSAADADLFKKYGIE